MQSELAVNLALAGIDSSTRQILRETWPVVQVRVPQVLDALYGQGSFRPDLNGEAQHEAKVAEARAAQEKHWEALFSAEFDEAYAASVSRIALTHVRVGLRPAWFISGYLVALTELHSLLVNCHAESIMSWRSRSRMEQAIRAVDKAVMFDLQLGVSAYCAEMDASSRRRIEDLAERCLAMTTAAESETTGVADDMDGALDRLRQAAALARDEALAAERDAAQVTAGITTAAEALERGAAATGVVTQQVLAAAAVTDEAAGALDRAAGDAGALGDVAAEASATAGEVARLAGRAQALLAEALARLGEAGLAAPQLSALAAQIGALDAQAASIAARSRAQSGAMLGIVDGVAGMLGKARAAVSAARGATARVADTLDGQLEATHAVSLAAAEAAAAAARVGRGAGAAAQNASRAAAEPQLIAGLAARLREQGAAQAAVAHGFIADIRAADRRAEPREPASASVVLKFGERELRGVLRDVSAGGALVLVDAAQLPDEPGPVRIRMPHSASATEVTIVGRDAHKLHLAFVDRARALDFMASALDRSACMDSSAPRKREMSVAA